MKRILVLLCGLLLFGAAYGDISDYSFRPMREKIRTKEDFLRLYNTWLYADLDSVSRNIYFLELATVVPFDHPIKALTVITNEMQYERYKNLIMMHLCRMLTQEYINYGYFYMKEHLYFFNEEFKKDYLDGYDIAEFYFTKSREYWNQALGYAQAADAVVGWRLDLHYYEDEIYKIKTGELDYYKVLDNLMTRIQNNRDEIVQMWGTNDLTNRAATN